VPNAKPIENKGESVILWLEWLFQVETVVNRRLV